LERPENAKAVGARAASRVVEKFDRDGLMRRFREILQEEAAT
jgi:hypothetical protein